MDSPLPADARLTESYLRLLTQHDQWLAAYVYSLVGNLADADEILQDCKMAMWKHFAGFTEGTNFRAWARRFALNHILNYRRAEKRRPATAVDDEFIQAVAGEIEQRAEELDRRAEALQHCLQKLPEAHRKLVVWRYYEECAIEEIAAKSERTVEAAYRLLSRVRVALNLCIGKQLAS